MRLNAGSLNAQPLHGVRRLPVHLEASALLEARLELAPTRARRAAGVAAARVSTELQAHARRYMRADAVTTASGQLVGQVARHGAATAQLRTAADLFYSRTLSLSGAFELGIALRGDVGVVFIGGGAEIHPLLPALIPNRVRPASGVGEVAASADLSPAAIRRTQVAATLGTEIAGGLDPAHISGGIRYLTAGLHPEVSVSAVDGGLRRQVRLGGAQIQWVGAGSGRRVRPGLSGMHARSLVAACAGALRRRTSMVAGIALHGDLRPDVLTPGNGVGTVEVRAALSTTIVRRAHGDARPFVFGALCAGDRVRSGAGAAAVCAVAAMDGQRYPRLAGRAPLTTIATVASPAIQKRATCEARAPVVTAELAGDGVARGAGALAIGVRFAAELVRTHIADMEGVVHVHLSGDGLIECRGDAGAPVSVNLDPMEARCVALVEGGAPLAGTECRLHPVLLRRTTGISVLPLSAACDGACLVLAHGTAEAVVTTAELGGATAKVLAGAAPIEVLNESDAYLNPAADDIDEQTFYRPMDIRDLFKPPEQREFVRPAA